MFCLHKSRSPHALAVGKMSRTLFITPIAMIALASFAINGIHRKGKKC
jgi:hypothetical protein